MSYIKTIKDIAEKNKDKNIRICFHESNDSALHQMLILERRDSVYYPPHIHQNRDELHYVFEGCLEVHLLGMNGKREKSVLNEHDSTTFTFANAGKPHLTRPRSKYTIYLEVKNGPLSSFSKECIRPTLVKDMGELEYLDHLSEVFK